MHLLEIRDLCRVGLDADAFRRALRKPLSSVVPFDGYCVNTADPMTLAITSSVGDGLSAADAAWLFAIEATGTDANPLCALAQASVPVATIGPRPERSERMRLLFLPRGWRDELRAALVSRGRCWGYLHLFRSTRFTRTDVDEVRRMAPSLAVALRTSAGNAKSAHDFIPGVVQVTKMGEVSASTASGEQALSLLPRDAAHEGPSHALLVVAQQAMTQRGRCDEPRDDDRGGPAFVGECPGRSRHRCRRPCACGSQGQLSPELP